jgi:hypothetical protein
MMSKAARTRHRHPHHAISCLGAFRPPAAAARIPASENLHKTGHCRVCRWHASMLWVADITYIPTWAGFQFLTVVLDAFSLVHITNTSASRCNKMGRSCA